jgi:hypothetical protein
MKRTIAAMIVVGGLVAGPRVEAQPIQNVVLQNSFNPIGAGARGLGMGGAFIAVADDGTAASFNPAGLAQLRRTELALVGFTDELTTTRFVPRGETDVQTSETKVRHSALDFGGLAIPFDVGGRNLTVQLSYQRSVDLFGKGQATVQDTILLSELDPSLKGTADFIADIAPAQEGAFHTVNLSAGYQATSRMALGVTFSYWLADWTAKGTQDFRLRIKVPKVGTVEAPLLQTTFDQKQSMRALSMNTGFLLKYPWISVGGIIRLPFGGYYDLEENDVRTTFDAQGHPLPPSPQQFLVTSRLHWPRSAGVGLALRPLKHLTLAGDYTHSYWSQTTIANVPAGALLTPVKTGPTGEREDSFNDRNFFDLVPASETSTNDTNSWHAGGEYLIVLPKVIVPLRGGYFRDRSPIADLGTDEGREIRGWTTGAGFNFSHLVLDVAFERRESQGNVSLRLHRGQPVQNPTGLSSESVKEDRFVASLIYRFGDNDPLKRAFRFLFGGPKDEGN